MNGWTRVYASSSKIDAQLVVNELLSHEIQGILLNKQDSSYLIGLCEVYVPTENAAVAQVIVDHFKSDETDFTDEIL